MIFENSLRERALIQRHEKAQLSLIGIMDTETAVRRLKESLVALQMNKCKAGRKRGSGRRTYGAALKLRYVISTRRYPMHKSRRRSAES